MTKLPHRKPAKSARTRVSTASREPSGAHDVEVETRVRDLGQMIDAARRQVAVAANAALTTLYWQLGHRVRTQVLDGQRAEYGKRIVAAVGRQLDMRYGRGFGEKSLRRMVQFATVFLEARLHHAIEAARSRRALRRRDVDIGPRPMRTRRR